MPGCSRGKAGKTREYSGPKHTRRRVSSGGRQDTVTIYQPSSAANSNSAANLRQAIAHHVRTRPWLTARYACEHRLCLFELWRSFTSVWARLVFDGPVFARFVLAAVADCRHFHRGLCAGQPIPRHCHEPSRRASPSDADHYTAVPATGLGQFFLFLERSSYILRAAFFLMAWLLSMLFVIIWALWHPGAMCPSGLVGLSCGGHGCW